MEDRLHRDYYRVLVYLRHREGAVRVRCEWKALAGLPGLSLIARGVLTFSCWTQKSGPYVPSSLSGFEKRLAKLLCAPVQITMDVILDGIIAE